MAAKSEHRATSFDISGSPAKGERPESSRPRLRSMYENTSGFRRLLIFSEQVVIDALPLMVGPLTAWSGECLIGV